MTIKRLTGNGTVAITGKTARAFTDYGNAPAGGTETFDALAARTNVLTDSSGGTVTAIVSQPAIGHARARSDGKLELCLVRESPTYEGELVVVYTRTGGSSPGTVTATITVAATPTYFGWSPDIADAFYTPEEDANNVIVVERRTAATRYLYTAPDGASSGTISGYHSGASVSGSFLHNTVALGPNGDGTSKWGETEALRVTEAVANTLIAYWRGSVRTQEYQKLYACGGVYTSSTAIDHSNIFGYSALFPNLVDSYGTGELPVFRGTGTGVEFNGLTYNTVLQRLSYENNMRMAGVRRVVLNKLRFDGIYNTGYSITMDGKNHYAHGLHLRFLYFINSYKRVPSSVGTWGPANSDRRSAAYLGLVLGLKAERIFSSESGWARGYRADRSTDYPQSPTDRSHGFYCAGNNVGVTFEDAIIGWPSQTYCQFRDCAYVARFFGWGSNGAVFVALGSGGVDLTPIDHRAFSSVTDCWVTRAGQKDIWRGPGLTENVNEWKLANALQDNGEMNSWRRFIASGSQLAVAFTSATELGPKRYGPLRDSRDNPYSPGANPYVMDAYITDWMDAVYERTTGLSGAEVTALRAATIEAWLQDRIGGTPKTITDVDNYLRGLDDPTEELESILEWVQSAAGIWVTRRSTGGDVHFLPPDDGSSPGHRGDLAENWDGLRLPGTFTGDSLYWDGARASSNFNAINTLDDYSFGSGAYIRMFGGKHESTGTLSVGTAGATLQQSQGSKFLFAGYSGSNEWTVDVTEARWHNKGTISGPVSVAGHYRSQVILAEGGHSFTVALGQAIECHGDAQVGWHDDGGGTSTITNNGTVRFFSQCTMSIDGITRGGGDTGGVRYGNILPRVGATVTFSGGGSARVAAIIELSQTAVTLILEDLAGPKPVNDETITGPTYAGADPMGTFAFASVVGTPTVTMGSMAEFRPSVSHHGAVNVTSIFAAASGAISPRVAWLSDGTYTLVTADDVTAVAPAIGENASGLASGKACRVTVNTSTNTVTMLIGNEGAGGLPASGFDLVVV
jgi:hypothetical protein